MNPFKSFQNYIAAQKSISFYFLFLGIFLLVIAAVSNLYSPEDAFYGGLFIGSLTTGLLIMLGGFFYRNFNDKLFISVESNYKKDKAIFLNNETNRMEKVLDDFSSFQIIFTIIIILAIGVIISFKIPYISGICIAISILLIGILLIEAISKYSIDHYSEELLKAHSSNFILQDTEYIS
ncbi:hypothetical protein [Gillisia hiemivivida]|uniref:Uncharacterized protein n=2 Tax=Gillisia hiemivivida TaxID=291190 RepID=A0A5C6ZVM0_9FLAO|nr:hypothetical protein ES724_07415 [Gillisia hiemivivida]